MRKEVELNSLVLLTVVQPCGLISCHLSNIISNILSGHFWDVPCTAAALFRFLSILKPIALCLKNSSVFYTITPFTCSTHTLRPNMSLTPCLSPLSTDVFMLKKYSKLLLGEIKRAALAVVWCCLHRQLKEHRIFEVIGILGSPYQPICISRWKVGLSRSCITGDSCQLPYTEDFAWWTRIIPREAKWFFSRSPMQLAMLDWVVALQVKPTMICACLLWTAAGYTCNKGTPALNIALRYFLLWRPVTSSSSSSSPTATVSFEVRPWLQVRPVFLASHVAFAPSGAESLLRGHWLTLHSTRVMNCHFDLNVLVSRANRPAFFSHK